MTDFVVSDDGFIMYEKLVSELLNTLGITNSIGITGENENINLYYDDWYIYSILDEKNESSYSLIKMREQEYDDGDGNAPGVTISFIPLDMNLLDDVISNKNNYLNGELDGNIAKVVQLPNQNFSPILQKYFAKTQSTAPYLIVDEYAKKIARESSENSNISAPNTLVTIYEKIEMYDELLSDPLISVNSDLYISIIKSRNELLRIPNAIDKVNEKSGRIIYDKNNHIINLENPSKLSYYEKLVILSTHTADTTYNMFAAEVEFHADALDSILENIPMWKESAIRADMSIGEEYESGIFDSYYNEDSTLIKEQEKYHGKK